MFIYKITNKVNGKIYIGKTIKSIEERFKKHIRCAENKINRHLYDAMNCYGYENFELTLVEICDTVDSLNQRESFWISHYNSTSPSGYNMTCGGDGGNTLIHWDDDKKRELWESQAKKRTGVKKSNSAKKNMSEAAKIRESKKTESEKVEISSKISLTLKKKYASGELVANTPKLYGENHPGFLDVDIDFVLKLIYDCRTLKEISKITGISPHGVRTRLVEKTGKNYLEWRREYGIIGSLSKPRRAD